MTANAPGPKQFGSRTSFSAPKVTQKTQNMPYVVPFGSWKQAGLKIPSTKSHGAFSLLITSNFGTSLLCFSCLWAGKGEQEDKMLQEGLLSRDANLAISTIWL